MSRLLDVTRIEQKFSEKDMPPDLRNALCGADSTLPLRATGLHFSLLIYLRNYC
jgi:hypothetical protein